MKQTRFVPLDTCNLQLREAQEGEQESREIVGMPIVCGVRSCNLTPWSEEREVYEVLEPGFITPELLQRSDVILNLNHSTLVTDVLGRYRNSERDTLSLDLLPNGMSCRCSVARTPNADAALELMRRGDIDGMSFAFSDNARDKESVVYERTAELHDGKEVWLRRVKRATGLFDVAIVTHPAYEQTAVATREFGEEIMRQIDAQIEAHKREQEAADDDEAKRKAEEEAKAEEERKAAEEQAKAEEEAKAKEEAEREAEEEQKERERMTAMLRQRNMVQRAHMLREQDIENFIV